jgi:hypothetical protein
MSYGTVTADLFRCIEQAQQGQVKVSSASRPNNLELGNALPTGKQLRKAPSEMEGIIGYDNYDIPAGYRRNNILHKWNLGIYYNASHESKYGLENQYMEKWGNDYFPASISPPGVIKPADNTSIVQRDICQRTDEVNEEDTNGRHYNHQAFINMQNNIVQCRMNRVRDQVVTPVTDEKNVFLDIHGKKKTSKSEEVNLATARLHFIFHSENSIDWNSFPNIKLIKSVLDSWIQFVQTNITQTAGGEEDTSKNVTHDCERIADCTLELPLKDYPLSKNYIRLLSFISGSEAKERQKNKMFDTQHGTNIIKEKMNIKYDGRKNKMNTKCNSRTPSATSNNHHSSKEKTKCYK